MSKTQQQRYRLVCPGYYTGSLVTTTDRLSDMQYAISCLDSEQFAWWVRDSLRGTIMSDVQVRTVLAM